MNYIIIIILRCVLAVVIGGLIGSERARHGRAAGMRTHILVCLGAALTSMISLYVAKVTGDGGDVLRLSAQVVSGIGFLGAGMIILKNNNVITGLTTAAGMWTTSVIGIAVGYGFYSGAVTVTVLYLATIILFAKFEKNKKSTEYIYIEIDDMYKLNIIIDQIIAKINTKTTHQITAPKSGCQGHIGISIMFNEKSKFDLSSLLEIPGVVFVDEE